MKSCPIEDGIGLRDGELFDQALACFRAAIEINHQPARAWFHLGLTHQTIGQLDKAEKAYRSALGLNPSYQGARGNLGVVLLRAKKFESALRCFDHLAALEPDNWRTHANRCDALTGCGRTFDAIEALEQACLRSALTELSAKERAELLVRRAKIEMRTLNMDAALVQAEAALQVCSDHVEALNCKGWILDQRGDYESALRVFIDAISVAPSDNWTRQNIGCTYLHLNRAGDALPFLEAVQTDMPQAFESHYNLGCAFAQLGRTADAIDMLRRSDELAPYINVRLAAASDPDLSSLAGETQFDLWIHGEPQSIEPALLEDQPALRKRLLLSPADSVYELVSGEEVGLALSSLLCDPNEQLRRIAVELVDAAVEEAAAEMDGCYDDGAAAWLYDYVRGLVPIFDRFVALFDDAAALSTRQAAAAGTAQLARALVEGYVRGPKYSSTRAALKAGLVCALPSVIAATTDSDTQMRSAAVRALGYFPFVDTKSLSPHLRKALGDDDASVRLEGARALRRLDGTSELEDLLSLAFDPDSSVARYAIHTLACDDEKRCIPALLRELHAMPTAAVVADVQRMAIPQAMPRLRDLVSAEALPCPEILRPALHALTEVGDESCIPALRRSLSNDDQLVRHAAVIALGRLRAKSAVGEIAALLPTAIGLHRQAQEIVAGALGRIGDPAAAPALLSSLYNPDAGAQEGFAEALALIGSHETLGIVRGRVASNPRRRGVLALGHLGDASDVALLDALIDNERVRQSAAMAIAMLDPCSFDANIAAILKVVSSKPLCIETFEEIWLARANAWRVLAERALLAPIDQSSRRRISETGLAWVAACSSAMPGALACFHRRGRVSGAQTGFALIIGDVAKEAEDGLHALIE